MVRVARPPIPLLLCLIALLLAPACTSKPRAADSSGKGVTRTDEQIFLGDTIERNYDPHVIIKRAEAFFDREEFAEAVVELQHFLELHRAHRLAPYAQFRLGEAHLHQARTIDRDPEPVLKAESIFRKLRAEFPKSRYDEEALARIRECHEWLAKTHLFVGKFYFRRGAYLAAAHRYQAILQEYPDMEVAPEAQYQLARTYEAFGAEEWAREQLTILTQRYPNSSTEKDAQKLLTKLGGRSPRSTLRMLPPPVRLVRKDNVLRADHCSPPCRHRPLPQKTPQDPISRERIFPAEPQPSWPHQSSADSASGVNHSCAQRLLSPFSPIPARACLGYTGENFDRLPYLRIAWLHKETAMRMTNTGRGLLPEIPADAVAFQHTGDHGERVGVDEYSDKNQQRSTQR